jgi:murein DD-endopeptidase MepM/ murein hydrolase activator NlpD
VPRRSCASLLLAAVLVVGTVAHASGEPLVQRATGRRHAIARELARIDRNLASHRRVTAWSLQRLERERAKLSSPLVLGAARWSLVQRRLRDSVLKAHGDQRRYTIEANERRRALVREREALSSWLATWGVFLTCPVAGPNSVADNFGITVRLPKVPVHRHMGNDIGAASGTPIVAPFDGYARASASALGGSEVRVEGTRGYVYNAHLSAFGKLGTVRAGDVIGYVGITGDATAAHDHFEWHPAGGLAVDPHPLLSVVC